MGAIAGLRPGDLNAVLVLPATMASRNAFDPFALVRSPIARNAVSCRNGTCWYSEATPASGRGLRRGTGRSATAGQCRDVLGRGAAAAAASDRPNSLVNLSWASASPSGVSG